MVNVPSPDHMPSHFKSEYKNQYKWDLTPQKLRLEEDLYDESAGKAATLPIIEH